MGVDGKRSSEKSDFISHLYSKVHSCGKAGGVSGDKVYSQLYEMMFSIANPKRSRHKKKRLLVSLRGHLNWPVLWLAKWLDVLMLL